MAKPESEMTDEELAVEKVARWKKFFEERPSLGLATQVRILEGDIEVMRAWGHLKAVEALEQYLATLRN